VLPRTTVLRRDPCGRNGVALTRKYAAGRPPVQMSTLLSGAVDRRRCSWLPAESR
jgi:hypothetical protein